MKMDILRLQGALRIVTAAFFLLAGIRSGSAAVVNIGGVHATSITNQGATVSWTSGVPADSQVLYGLTTTYGSLTTTDATLLKSHSQTLDVLVPNAVYHYSVRSRDASGALEQSADFTFTTLPTVVTGLIDNVTASGITGNCVTINWTTTSPANSGIDFGPTSNYGWTITFGAVSTKAHTLRLCALTPNTQYHYRVVSVDGNGNKETSGDYAFTTLLVGSPSLFIAITGAATGATSAYISWTTTIQATARVEYGTTLNYGNMTPVDDYTSIPHTFYLSGLTPGTLYHFRVRSAPPDGEFVSSDDLTFVTPAASLFYPRVSLDQDSFTSMALTDPERSSPTIDLTAFDSDGSTVRGNGITNPLTQTLASGAQLAAIEYQIYGSGLSNLTTEGWGQIDSSANSVEGFYLTFNGTLTYMDGANFAAAPLNSLILPENGTQSFTKLFLANTAGAAAGVTIELVAADGTVRNSFSTTLSSHAAYFADLASGIFPGGGADPSDYFRVTSTRGIVGFEYLGNPSSDVAVLSGQDTGAGATSLYSPQFVLGGPWRSTLSVVNLDSISGNATLKWIGDDGAQIGSTRTVNLNPNGKVYVSDPSFFLGSSVPPPSVTEGYVQITSSGIRLSGSVVFSDAARGAFMTALPLVRELRKSQVLSHVASNDTYFTGIAIMNPNTVNATVTIELFTSSGSLAKSVTRVIPAGHRTSELITQYFPDQVGQDWHSGYVRVTSDNVVACFGVFGTQNLSVLAAIPAQATQ